MLYAQKYPAGDFTRLANHKNFHLPKYECMLSIGNTNNPKECRKAGKTIGSYLKKYDFDVNFAPVADVNTNPETAAKMDTHKGYAEQPKPGKNFWTASLLPSGKA